MLTTGSTNLTLIRGLTAKEMFADEFTLCSSLGKKEIKLRKKFEEMEKEIEELNLLLHEMKWKLEARETYDELRKCVSQ